MKNRKPNLPPTPEELYALERSARAARAAEISRLLVVAASALKALFARGRAVKDLSHA